MTLATSLHGVPVAVIIPADPAGDQHRIAALGYVATWYQHHFPRWDIHVGSTSGQPWSKGLAVRAALDGVAAPVYVIADADSFIADPTQLRAAVDDVAVGRRQWVTPHQYVYRLKPDETERVLAGERPRLGRTHRAPYEGPIGGGITVLTAQAWETVNGIDPAFQGWGGEDVAFGWALETLCDGERQHAELVHLWHPHPAPTLRGSPESEALVDLYKQARGRPRRMRHLLDHGTLPDIDPVDPVTFRMVGPRRTIRIGGGSVIVRFDRGTYTTTDPDEIDALRASGIVTEEKRRATP